MPCPRTRTEAVFDGPDLNATGVDVKRLEFAQRQGVMTFLADSAHYLGLAEAAAHGIPARAALPCQTAQLSAFLDLFDGMETAEQRPLPVPGYWT